MQEPRPRQQTGHEELATLLPHLWLTAAPEQQASRVTVQPDAIALQERAS